MDDLEVPPPHVFSPAVFCGCHRAKRPFLRVFTGLRFFLPPPIFPFDPCWGVVGWGLDWGHNAFALVMLLYTDFCFFSLLLCFLSSPFGLGWLGGGLRQQRPCICTPTSGYVMRTSLAVPPQRYATLHLRHSFT